METLYSRNGDYPTALPFRAYDESGRSWTDLANNPEGIEDCGFVAAPEPPVFDPATHRLDWDGDDWVLVEVPPPPIPSLEERKAGRIAEVNAKRDALLAEGAVHPGTGLHIPLTDGSRADLGSMATTASLVLQGVLPWPEDYARGWITIENQRIPMPTPQDGVQVAAVAGVRYAAVVQFARDLKDQIAAAADEAALDAIDIDTGWPT